MTIMQSVYTLAKTNNGFFKSEKQASFLIATLAERQGVFCELYSFGANNGAQARRNVFVSWDSNGITEIKTVAEKSHKTNVLFARIDESVFQAKQAKKAQELAQYKAENEQWYANKFAELEMAIAEEKQSLIKLLSDIEDAIASGIGGSIDKDLLVNICTNNSNAKVEKLERDLAQYKARFYA
jgi:hypothetical protein